MCWDGDRDEGNVTYLTEANITQMTYIFIHFFFLPTRHLKGVRRPAAIAFKVRPAWTKFSREMKRRLIFSPFGEYGVRNAGCVFFLVRRNV